MISLESNVKSPEETELMNLFYINKKGVSTYENSLKLYFSNLLIQSLCTE
jgi:hypothetical protein